MKKEINVKVLSVEEQAALERDWARSEERARIDARRQALKEAIAQRTGAYSSRC